MMFKQFKFKHYFWLRSPVLLILGPFLALSGSRLSRGIAHLWQTPRPRVEHICASAGRGCGAFWDMETPPPPNKNTSHAPWFAESFFPGETIDYDKYHQSDQSVFSVQTRSRMEAKGSPSSIWRKMPHWGLRSQRHCEARWWRV